MLTKTNIEVNVTQSTAKHGVVMLEIEGEVYPLTAADAEAIGKRLRDAALDATRTTEGK